MKSLHLIIISFCIALISGCLKEDLSNCRKLHYLTFEYTKNKQGTDLFSSQVKALDVYVFDKDGKYIKYFSDKGAHFSSSSYSIPIDIPDGEYTFVVWGDVEEAYYISDQSDINAGQQLQTGLSSFNNSRLSLKAGQEYPEDLFFGIAKQVHINSNKSNNTHIQLIKNTNTLHITVNGIQNIRRSTSSSSFDLICYLANGELKFDNSISLPERLFQYIPVKRDENEDTLTYKVKTLRLLTDMKSQLILQNKTTGEDIFNENIIHLLLLSPDINNNDDLDTNDEYNINLSVNTNQSITISVNGYVVINSDQDLQ